MADVTEDDPPDTTVAVAAHGPVWPGVIRKRVIGLFDEPRVEVEVEIRTTLSALVLEHLEAPFHELLLKSITFL